MQNERTKRLRNLMRDNSLSVAAVAELLGRSPTTVRIWRCKTGSRVIPANELRLLEMEVKQRACA